MGFSFALMEDPSIGTVLTRLFLELLQFIKLVNLFAHLIDIGGDVA